jgi:hypothetical protein
MIEPIHTHYLKLVSDLREATKVYGPDHPELWDLTPEEKAYLERIIDVDSLTSYPWGDERMAALAEGCALALGLSKVEAALVASDPQEWKVRRMIACNNALARSAAKQAASRAMTIVFVVVLTLACLATYLITAP